MASEVGRLPTWVKPVHYTLSISDLVIRDPWSYQGNVSIVLALQRDTKHITLHARYLKIHAAEISIQSTKDEEMHPAVDIAYDAHAQRCTLTFGQTIPGRTEHHAILSIRFEGTMNDDLVGFYRSTYEADSPTNTPNRTEQNMFSTQFQPCEARRAFPCFDEPDLKATFDFEIETPAGMTALSNMPVKNSTDSIEKKGRQVIAFERTPVMSSYLLAWAVGDFEYIETQTTQPSGKVLPIRLYTTRGLMESGRFALDLAEKIVPYFTEQFHVEYPLPKLDMIAVQDMADSMENWGLIMYEMSALLFDPDSSDPSSRNNVAYTVAHEIAHQWFGNLVTMQWWDDLWLNEGFATWAGWLAVDHFFPEWSVWADFVGTSMQEALQLDALQSSHPIRASLPDDLEVDSVFDSISYEKGCALIRMVASHMGVDAFLQGVSDYLKEHSYKNTEAKDLWVALGRRSHEDLLSFVTPWVEEMGFPAVTAQDDSLSKAVHVKQQRFRYNDSMVRDAGRKLWPIPFACKRKQTTDELFLKIPEMDLPDGTRLFRVPNRNYSGFFRTNFLPDQVARLGCEIDQLSVTERVGIIADVSALALAEGSEVNTTTLLDFLDRFREEENYHVWDAMITSLDIVQSMFSHHAGIAEGLNGFIRNLVRGAVEKLGWVDPKAASTTSTNYLPGELRAKLILSLGLAGDKKVIAESKRRFKEFFNGDRSAIPLSLQPTVFQLAVKHMGREAYEQLRSEYSQTTSIDGEETILTAIGEALSTHLEADFLQFTFSDDVDIQNAGTAGGALAANTDIQVRERLWAFVRDNWDIVFNRLGGSMVVFERLIRASLETLTSRAVRIEIEEFFRMKDTTGYGRGIAIVLEKIENHARYVERDTDILDRYITARKGG